MNYIVNNNPKVSRITSMDFLNAHDLTLLLTGTGKNQNYSLHPCCENLRTIRCFERVIGKSLKRIKKSVPVEFI